MTLPKPKCSDAALSERMRRQAVQDTAGELLVRRLLFSRGLRYRIQLQVPGFPRRSIDIAFPARKLAVNIDGCFWHGCHMHRPLPRANRDWWALKIYENQRRDRETDAHLVGIGWTALRFWEHESPQDVVAQIIHCLE